MRFEKNGKKYIKIGKRAIEYKNVDENGRLIIVPKIIRKKDKNGKDHLIVKIPSLKIKYKTNGKRNI